MRCANGDPQNRPSLDTNTTRLGELVIPIDLGVASTIPAVGGD